MTDHENLEPRAHSEEHKTLLGKIGVLVFDQYRPVVKEDGLCSFERHAVLALVVATLRLVPFEAQVRHGAGVATS